MVRSAVRFVLTDINEDEIRDEGGYDKFEPTVTLEIEGKNIFEEFGDKGLKPVVIMHSIEDAFRECKRMAGLYERVLSIFEKGAYMFPFHGTGCHITLEQEGDELEVILDVEGYGPIGNLKCGSHRVGRVAIGEWIEAVVTLAKEVRDLFKRHNPRLYAIIKKQWFH
ncbi:MAG: hypothetical protein ACE5IO_07790, partial [Thermoplasmata archaeon]